MNEIERTNIDLLRDNLPLPSEIHNLSLAVNDEFDTDTDMPPQMDQLPVNTLPDTLLPNPTSGTTSDSPLVHDHQLASETQKPPDIVVPPLRRITRSMTKLGTAISDITFHKNLEVRIQNLSPSHSLSTQNIKQILTTIFSNKTNVQAIKKLSSSASAPRNGN